MIQDAYRKDRGGYARMLELRCRKCGVFVARYQKDGPGSLRRLYLDRIREPEKLAKLGEKSVRNIPPLRCPSCKELLGTPMLYEKERRKAFRLYQDAVTKSVVRDRPA